MKVFQSVQAEAAVSFPNQYTDCEDGKLCRKFPSTKVKLIN